MRHAGQAIDIGIERDHRLAGAPAGDPHGGYAGHAILDGEARIGQDAGQVALGFNLLEAQFGKTEDRFDDLLGQLGLGVDIGLDLGLERGQVLGQRGRSQEGGSQ